LSLVPRLHEELAELKKEYPQLRFAQLPDGTLRIEIEKVPLPEGFSKQFISLLVVVPVQYPNAMPVGYVDHDIHLANGASLSGVGTTTIDGRTWGTLCWQPHSWNMSQENLLRFVKFILQRFYERQ